MRAKSPLIWVGGKSKLMDTLELFFPAKYKLYIEPFVGGGSVFLHTMPERAILMDVNNELINFYTVVRDNVELLVDNLRAHKRSKEHFYVLRDIDVSQLDEVQRASRFLYINRNSFRGLWRVNKSGGLNTTYGGRGIKERHIENLWRVSESLKRAELICGDYSNVLDIAEEGSFIYMDPPYNPIQRNSFTGYTRNGFKQEDQIRLAKVVYELDSRGCMVMMSNSNTQFIKKLYKKFRIDYIDVERSVGRGIGGSIGAGEVVIRNYR
jgi:DNA adenine methylase